MTLPVIKVTIVW